MCDLNFISEKQNVDSYLSDFNYDLLLNDDFSVKRFFSKIPKKRIKTTNRGLI